MRLVIATPLYPPEIGGPATDAAALEGALRARGEEPVVVAFAPVRVLPKLLRHAVYGLRLLRALRGADVVIAFDTVSVGLPATLATLVRGVPLVLRVPGDYAWEQGVQRFGVADSIEAFQTTRYGWRVELLRTVQNFVARRARLVLAPSDYFAGVIAAWGARPERVKRIYLGLAPLSERREPAHASAGKLIVSIGRFVPWKGFDMLIDLLPDLAPAWQLVLVGDGPRMCALKERAASRGVAHRVRFTGAVPREEALGWLGRADAFVLNTSFESFSFQVLEAMMVGAPVIATTAGSLPELLRNGAQGLLLPPNDHAAFLAAIRSIEQEPAAWRERVAAAKARAASFLLETSAAAFAEALTTLCA